MLTAQFVTLLAATFIAGGCAGIMLMLYLDRPKARTKPTDYDPWEYSTTAVYEEPMPHMMEAPISARKK